MGSNGDFSVPQNQLSLTGHWQRCLSESLLADPGTFLAAHPEASVREILDVVLIDQRAKWQSEPGPRVEEYLQRFPQLAEDDDTLLDLLYGEVRARRKLGFTVRPDQLAERFPQVADDLLTQLEVAGWLDDRCGREEMADTIAGVRQPSMPSAADRESPDLPDGQTDFGEYRLIERIGRGGMGVIYRAQHRVLGQTVAIKMLSFDRLNSNEEFQRFQNEIQAVALFNHSNILPIFEVGECDGTPFFTTRLLERGSLADNHQQFRHQPKTIATLAAAMARAVHHAHQRGVLHRDLKPSNILIDENNQPLIADFGLAQLLQGSNELTRTGEFVGTAAWMAPERAVPKPGAATTAVDVYGLGAILYFLLTGRAPFDGEGLLDTLTRVCDGRLVPPRQVDPSVNRDLEMICLTAMDRDPSRRYATAELLAEDLERYLRGEPVNARPLPQYAQWARRIKRHPVVAAIVGTLALASVMLLGMGTYYTVQQARLTGSLKDKTNEAEVSRKAATRLAVEAEEIRDEALTARRDHRELLYAAHIREVADALAAGDMRHADDFLNRQLPAADDSDLRGLEWYWLRKQCSIGKPLHEVAFSNPRCLQYSPDQRWLAVGDSEGDCFLLNADTMEIVRSWTTPHDMVESVSFSPSSELLATAGDDLVAVWDVKTNLLLQSMTMTVEQFSWKASFIDDQRLVAWSRRDKVMILDMSDPTSQTELATNVDEVRDVAVWHPRKLLAVLGRTGLQRFNSESLQEVSMRNR
ncbi:MAG: serine/threonine-protein kinase [Planctomycetaceae bacterium]